MNLRKRLFVQAAIQSNSHDPRDLLARVELFLETFLVDLAAPATEARFAAVKDSLLARLAQPYDTLASKQRFLNRLAFEEDGDFHYLQRRIEALQQLQVADVVAFADRFLSLARNRNRLAVLSHGTSPENRELTYQSLSPEHVASHAPPLIYVRAGEGEAEGLVIPDPPAPSMTTPPASPP